MTREQLLAVQPRMRSAPRCSPTGSRRCRRTGSTCGSRRPVNRRSSSGFIATRPDATFPARCAWSGCRAAAQPLVRASITDISERKRAEIIMENERAFFALLASNAGLPAVLDVISALVQAVYPRCRCTISVLAPDAQLLRADDRAAPAADARGGARAHADRAAARFVRRRRLFGLRRLRAGRRQRCALGRPAPGGARRRASAPSGRCPSRAPAASC